MDRNVRCRPPYFAPRVVATREGGVDRNSPCGLYVQKFFVATREGGVDRNVMCYMLNCDEVPVATREGGVDRN